MMLGMDYPHHEGTMTVGTQAYLRATLGDAGVPIDEARAILGGNAAKVFGFDVEALRPVADRVGPEYDSMLQPSVEEWSHRGDVYKPVAFV
jgi:hypothetical protein